MWCHTKIPWGINPDFSGLFPSTRQIAYALRTRAPVSKVQAPSTPRLACVKPAASVHPEPGSNSSSYILIMYGSKSDCLKFNSNVFFILTLCSFQISLEVLSIQYVYERVFLFLAPELSFSKRVQKYDVNRDSQEKNSKKIDKIFLTLKLNK